MATQNNINNKSQELTVNSTPSGDSFVQFDINGTGEFRAGIYDTDDSFRISQGSALSTNDTFVMTENGERTMPLQPAFSVQNNADQALLTETVTLTFPNETFDQNNDFDGISTFTAPITGRYLLGYVIYFEGIDSTTMLNVDIRISTSNGNYFGIQQNFLSGIAVVANGGYCHAGSAEIDMDAGDTATISVRFGVAGFPPLGNVIVKGASVVSRRCPVFYGYLIC